MRTILLSTLLAMLAPEAAAKCADLPATECVEVEVQKTLGAVKPSPEAPEGCRLKGLVKDAANTKAPAASTEMIVEGVPCAQVGKRLVGDLKPQFACTGVSRLKRREPQECTKEARGKRTAEIQQRQKAEQAEFRAAERFVASVTVRLLEAEPEEAKVVAQEALSNSNLKYNVDFCFSGWRPDPTSNGSFVVNFTLKTARQFGGGTLMEHKVEFENPQSIALELRRCLRSMLKAVDFTPRKGSANLNSMKLQVRYGVR